MARLDLLLRGGTLADGTGRPLRRADVGVCQGRLVVLPEGESADAAELVDVSGLVVAPGFIDAHTHSDALADATPDAEPECRRLQLASVLQGVTTEIAGNCGSSLFPSRPERRDLITEFAHANFGPYARVADSVADLTTPPRRRTHLGALVGHGTLRAAVLGYEERPPTSDELDTMTRLLHRELSAGAVGMSSGLIYPPGSYADTAELVALAGVLACHGKPYVTHVRDEMSRVEDALEEALEIGRKSGAPVHVSHHKTAGRRSWGLTRTTLARLNEARREGMDVTCDVYPYSVASTHLHAMLPPWCSAGGVGAMLRRVSDPAVRERVRRDIATGIPGWENTVGNGGWDLLSIASAPRHPRYEGRRVAELAAAADRDPVEWVCALLRSEAGAVMVLSHSMDEADVSRVLSWPSSSIGSDGVPRGRRPHPRWAGSFARVLGWYVREQNLFSLEHAVHKMTGLPAARFGLHDRGIVTDGKNPDLVVFDPQSIRDRADFHDPLASPDGVRVVVVAGQVAVRDGEPTEVRPGTVQKVPT